MAAGSTGRRTDQGSPGRRSFLGRHQARWRRGSDATGDGTDLRAVSTEPISGTSSIGAGDTLNGRLLYGLSTGETLATAVAEAVSLATNHGDGGKSYQTYRQMRKKQKPLGTYRFKGTGEDGDTQAYYSPTIGEDLFYERDAKRRFFNQWEQVVSELDGTGKHKTVGIFPYASMQIENKTD